MIEILINFNYFNNSLIYLILYLIQNGNLLFVYLNNERIKMKSNVNKLHQSYDRSIYYSK